MSDLSSNIVDVSDYNTDPCFKVTVTGRGDMTAGNNSTKNQNIIKSPLPIMRLRIGLGSNSFPKQ